MTKILDKTYLSGSIAKLVELPNYYIKNGIKYDKINSIMQSNSAYNFNSGLTMIIDKMAFNYDMSSKNYYQYNPYRRKSIIKDNNKDNTYYLLHGLADKSYSQSFFILEDSEKNPTIKTKSFTASDVYISVDMIGQTDSHILLFTMRYPEHNTKLDRVYSGISIASKYDTSSSFSNTLHLNYSDIPQVINFDGNFLQIGSLENGNFSIRYYNIKNETTLEEVFKSYFYCASQTYPYRIKFSDIDKKTNRIYIPYVREDANTKVSIMSFDLDAKTQTEINITDIEYDMRYFALNGLYYFCELLEQNNNRYLILGRTFSPIVTSVNMEKYKDQNKFYLFKIKNNGELELKDISNNRVSYNTVIFDNELGSLIASNGNVTDVIKINYDEKFEKVYRHEREISSFGLSMDKNLFFYNKDNSVDEVSIGYGQDLIVKLENERYFYNGTNIDTYFETGITDLLGNFIDTRVEFTLSGDATFNDGTKKKIIKLSKDGLLTVPIMIKGALKVCVDGKIIL